jgi:hypothetical protein
MNDEPKKRFVPPANWFKWPTRDELVGFIIQENKQYKRLFKLYQNLLKAIAEKDRETIKQHIEFAESEDFEEYKPIKVS